ncbi:hypothetical protein L211DRAFT_888304 [Terfezia boudieri ATCC MYA-4762]|uniref:Uncharacterized protein n=1 Tax=Terfezia boudieri ATCC MYA-4762 TaxID=1051890 RepID=A0A3N4LMC7_9PEZI|nr:hypothetical protein L211DRAFT_888304 [Terfezia boudieri ATCC MYA-4762]
MPIMKEFRCDSQVEEAQLWDLREQALRGTSSPSNGGDEVVDTPKPILIVHHQWKDVKTKHSEGAGSRKSISGPASASKPENADNESTTPSSLTEDVSIFFPPPLQLHTSQSTCDTGRPRAPARRPVPSFLWPELTKSHARKPSHFFPLAKVNKPEPPLVAKRGDTSYRGIPVAGLLEAAEISALDKVYDEWRHGRARKSPRCDQLSVASLLNPIAETGGDDLDMIYE